MLTSKIWYPFDSDLQFHNLLFSADGQLKDGTGDDLLVRILKESRDSSVASAKAKKKAAQATTSRKRAQPETQNTGSAPKRQAGMDKTQLYLLI